MKHVKLHGVERWMISTMVILYFLFISLVGILFYFAFQNTNGLLCLPFVIPFSLLVVFFTVLVCYEIYRYHTSIVISPEALVITYPTRKVFTIPKEKIISFGRVGLGVNNFRMYFCADPETVVWDFFQSHKSICRRRFGKKLTEELERTEEGQWKLAMATYVIWSKSPNVILLDQLSESTFTEIAFILEVNRMDTGAFLF